MGLGGTGTPSLSLTCSFRLAESLTRAGFFLITRTATSHTQFRVTAVHWTPEDRRKHGQSKAIIKFCRRTASEDGQN